MADVIGKLLDFASREDAAISLDWLVLTGLLVGTGLSVMSTVTGGIEAASLASAQQVRGQVIRQSFGPDNLCAHGIDGLRAREAARVAAGGGDAVDVDAWLPAHAAGLSDASLRAERDRMARLADASGPAGGWSRARTLQALLECGIAQRGL